VNGIGARQAQVLEWIQRDQPDVICLPGTQGHARADSGILSAMPDYLVLTGMANVHIPAVGLLIPPGPGYPIHHVLNTPDFDFETRITVTPDRKNF